MTLRCVLGLLNRKNSYMESTTRDTKPVFLPYLDEIKKQMSVSPTPYPTPLPVQSTPHKSQSESLHERVSPRFTRIIPGEQMSRAMELQAQDRQWPLPKSTANLCPTSCTRIIFARWWMQDQAIGSSQSSSTGNRILYQGFDCVKFLGGSESAALW